MEIPILYEDAHLLAVEKSSGQLVIPGRGDIPGEPLAVELKRQTGRPIYVVHRLDRGASGIVLFAKDAAAHRRLSMQFEERSIHKTYQVLAEGTVTAGGRIEEAIRAFGSGRMGIDPAGKPSTTEYTVLEQVSGASLLTVSPITGRRHQIRVHLYSIGHPVMGDSLYGTNRPVGGAPRLMLHAWKIAWEGPDGKTVSLECPPPEDFTSFVNRRRA